MDPQWNASLLVVVVHRPGASLSSCVQFPFSCPNSTLPLHRARYRLDDPTSSCFLIMTSQSSTNPLAEHEGDVATALENVWKPFADTIAEFRSLERKHKSIPPLSPGRNIRISALQSDLFTTEREFAHQTQRVEDYEAEVKNIEATLVTTKAKLAEEETQLQLIGARKSDAQNALQILEQETKEKGSLESQMLAKKIELSELLKLARPFKDRLPSNTSNATVEPTPPPPTAPVVNSFMLESDIPQSNLEKEDNAASGFQYTNTVDDSTIYEIHSDTEEDIYPEPSVKDDSEYVECDAITDEGEPFEHAFDRKKRSSNLSHQCRRCEQRGYACERPNKRSNRACIRCQDDGIPCSIERPRKRRRPGRQADEELNARLRYLREVQNLSFAEIVEMNYFPRKSISSLRTRMRRLKDRDSKGEAQPGNERQNLKAAEETPGW